jgi:DNA (cytosine-5)-methyltransferase 1
MSTIRSAPRLPSIITAKDLFCGGGGGSLGFKLAMWLLFGSTSHGHVDWAINHWPKAVMSHNENFPDTNHDCLDISKADPRRYRSAFILIAGPSCTDHTPAKGKQITNQNQIRLDLGPEFDTVHDEQAERTRVTMLDIPRFAAIHHYPIIICENVVEVKHWAGYTRWQAEMHKLGYVGKEVYFNSMFAGVPQSRDRWYYVWIKKSIPMPNLNLRPRAHCLSCDREGGAVQTWKRHIKQWGKYGLEHGSYFYRCATCHLPVEPYRVPAWTTIDWSRRAERIGSRSRPLSAKTMRRIQAGIERYGQEPFSVDLAHAMQADGYTRPLELSWSTLTTAQTLGYASPFMVRLTHPSDGNEARKAFPMLQPTPTLTCRQDTGLALPRAALIELHGTSTARTISGPCGALLAGGNHHALIADRMADDRLNRAFLAVYNGTDAGHPMYIPSPALTTVQRHALMTTAARSTAVPDILDWYFRMLHTDELRRIAGFPGAEQYTLLGSERDISRMIGQAMSPIVIALLIARCLLAVPGIGVTLDELVDRGSPLALTA